MNTRQLVFLAFIVFFAHVGISWAVDYKEWIPFIPDEMDGLKAQSKKDGMNMEMDGQKTSSLTVTYSEGVKQSKVSVMYSGDPGMIEAQRSMGSMSLETPEFVMKPIEIEGFKGSYHDDKKSKRVQIMLFFNDNALLIFEADGGKDEKHYAGLVKKINLKKIYSTLKQ
ncbi:hypothetical protein [Kaarinaea lacus]